jgi:6-phosphogluconolactonase
MRCCLFGMVLVAAMCGIRAASADAETRLYLSVAGEKHIAIYDQDAATGELRHQADVPTTGEPGALCVDPARRRLFAALRSTGQLAAFRIDPATGGLTHLNTVEAGADPAQISTDRTGQYLLTAYYVAAKATVHAIDDDGTLSAEPLQTVPTADKAHAIMTDRSNRFAFVPHTGPNVIFQFRFDPAKGELTANDPPRLETPPDRGPRHVTFHPTLDVTYIDDEQGSSVTAYAIARPAGTLSPLATAPTIPADFAEVNSTAELRIHPTGRFLYVANRGHDSIACFTLNDAGLPTPIGQARTEQTPRSFDLSPDGAFLYAAGESSGKLAGYRVHPDDGTLRRMATCDVGKQPWWVMAVELPTEDAE